jgi:hypothetical protein
MKPTPVTTLVHGVFMHSWVPAYPVVGDEGICWVYGHHAWDSGEVRAMRAAQALLAEA